MTVAGPLELPHCPGKKSSKPDALSQRPDLNPSEEEQLKLGQLLRPNTFTVAAYKSFFEDKNIDLDNAEYC
ncbi:uncharacterized protein VP01_6238g1 [Puccinia sorghi]|uniref:Uncharacterized protein n=1 Tax=Puccinia sorghi TaxID=27349 RepID=A0A0L6UIL6_9BASI|nr:uncharacterized protein VP01_6238g1 [Puccinia sorghi]